MNWLTLQNGSKWPDPNYKDSVNWNPMAEAYKDLIMGDLTLQQTRDIISLIRQAAGRPRIPPRKSKKSFFYKDKWYTWWEIAEMSIHELTRELIVSRQRSDWSIEKIIKTPVRKWQPKEKNYKGFPNKEDYDALHQCTTKQRKILGLA